MKLTGNMGSMVGNIPCDLGKIQNVQYRLGGAIAYMCFTEIFLVSIINYRFLCAVSSR